MDRADADPGEDHDLVEVIAPVRMAEKQDQYLTLRPGKERVTHADGLLFFCTQIGNDNTFIGNYQRELDQRRKCRIVVLARNWLNGSGWLEIWMEALSPLCWPPKGC